MSAPSPQSSHFEALPRYIITSSILPFITSHDWLIFRAASRGCYEIVHDTTDVDHSYCPVCQSGNWIPLVKSDNPSPNRGRNGNTAASDDAEQESETLWRLALVRDYGFEETDDEHLFHQCIHCPDRPRADAFLETNDAFTASHSFIAWKHWRKIDLDIHHRRDPGEEIPVGERVVGPYFLRALSMWKQIEQWCDDERSGNVGDEIRYSLQTGQRLDPNSDGRVESAQSSAFKAVYAFWAGQCDPSFSMYPPDDPRRFNPFNGIFGGFQAYHMVSSTRWEQPEYEHDSSQTILLLASGEGKVMAMDLEIGQVFFLALEGNAQNPNQQLIATPCPSGINSRSIRGGGIVQNPTDTSDCKDSILRWFEEHANRLTRNHYSVGNIIANHPGDNELQALLRYPAVADTANCSRAVTRGVEVLASSLFVQEMGMFVYSIRIRLLTPDDGEDYMSEEQRGFNTCQLVSRHWKISKSSRVAGGPPSIEEVHGEGVIGLYPLLQEGGFVNYESDPLERPMAMGQKTGYFSYQSCTEARPGSLGGHLQFRPGSIAKPTGDLFNVRVAPFSLEVTNFLY